MDFFTLYIYQPFLNILIGLYYLTGQVFGTYDMGIAVILFSVAVRLIILPLDLLTERSDDEKLIISQKMAKLNKDLAHDPIKLRAETKRLMRQSPGALISEIVNIAIQLIIIIMLYRIFTTGLVGEDLHLIYSFLPKVDLPLNLMFLGQFDLTHTNYTLNILQSIIIAINEIIHLSFAPVKPTQKDFFTLVFLFPLGCFLLFMLFPAGKKLFIITSLLFSITIQFLRQVTYFFFVYTRKHTHKPLLEAE